MDEKSFIFCFNLFFFLQKPRTFTVSDSTNRIIDMCEFYRKIINYRNIFATKSMYFYMYNLTHFNSRLTINTDA